MNPFLFVFIIVFLLLVLYTTKNFAPFVPTLKANYSDLVKSLQYIADTEKKDDFSFVDLGCGSGRILTLVNRKFPSMQVTGIELNPIFYIYSKAKSLFFPHTVKFRDIYRYNPTDHDIIYIFGFKDTTDRFEKYLKKYNYKGYIVSYFFDLKFTEVHREGNFRVYRVE
jgi:trans-aconitate methyltransferase